jgi:hypothetical protein
MSVLHTDILRESPPSHSSLTTEVFQEDVHRTLRVIYRDGGVIEKTHDEIAHDIQQLRIHRENEVKLKKGLENQFSLLIDRLKKWCEDNSDILSMACCVPSVDYSKVYFFAIQNNNAYNQEFSQNLTRLEIEVEDSEQFYLVNMKVLELPKMDEEAVQKFVNNYTSSL